MPNCAQYMLMYVRKLFSYPWPTVYFIIIIITSLLVQEAATFLNL